MVFQIIVAAALGILITYLQGKDLKSEDIKIKKNARATIIITIILVIIQSWIAIEQDKDNTTLSNKVSHSDSIITALNVNIDTLNSRASKQNYKLDSISGRLTDVMKAINDSRLEYKNGEIVNQKEVNSKNNLPNAKFNAPVLFGDSSKQINYMK